MGLAYLTPDKLDKVKNIEFVEQIIEKYFGSCIRFDGANEEELCMQELRQIDEDFVADNLEAFIAPAG